MVLPRSQLAQCGEVGVGVLSWLKTPSHVRDIETDNLICDLRHDRVLNASLPGAEDANKTIKEPDGAGSIYPHLIAPFAFKEKLDVVPTSNNDKDCEEDVEDEEDLVSPLTDPKESCKRHDYHSESTNNAPDPIQLLGLSGMLREVDDQFDDGVDDCLDDENPGNPSVEEEVGVVRPVGDGEQEVVA